MPNCFILVFIYEIKMSILWILKKNKIFMKKMYEKFISMFNNDDLELKITKLEDEIEEIRELTTNNYWKLRKEFIKNGKGRKKVVHSDRNG
jgi:hypothetical protein